MWRMLNSSLCPLCGDELELAKRNFAFSQARSLYRRLKRGQFATVGSSLHLLGLSPADWMTYLRPPRRRASAGTPSEASGLSR
jgi:hypothetical protein